MNRTQAWISLLAALLFAGCAMGSPARVTDPGVDPGQVDVAVSDLERAQLLAVAEYDGTTAGDDRCEQLCTHLDAICALGARICELARAHPSVGNEAACQRAIGRCGDANARMPPECSVCTE